MKPFTKKIVLENGREFYGYGFGADREAINEIVFNTSMVGYQEILSDPSYTDQMVVMTYPLIGNYGTAEEDYETKFPTIGGMIVREYNDTPSNFRYTKTLHEVLEEHNIPAVSGDRHPPRSTTRLIPPTEGYGSRRVGLRSDRPTADGPSGRVGTDVAAAVAVRTYVLPVRPTDRTVNRSGLRFRVTAGRPDR